MSTWKKVHKSSGATVIERGGKGCRLTVIPKDWTKPKGAANWAVSCRGDHERGSTASVKTAKSAATRVARKMKKGR